MQKLKIALIGYGKMGRMVERAAQERGHVIVAKNTRNLDLQSIEKADVCIDFTHPDCILNNVREIAPLKKNLVIGTTGWYSHLEEVKKLANQHQIGLLYAPNFSLGVLLFVNIVAEAAKLLAPFDEYDIAIQETHHTQKADSPSGTAKALGQTILDHLPRKTKLIEQLNHLPIPQEALHISSQRCGLVPGTHTVLCSSAEDSITLTHQAHNRSGFARGAITAAEWLQGKKGIYTLNDLLKKHVGKYEET